MRAASAPTAVAVDGDDVWWSEARPGEGGRVAVLRRRGDGTVTEVLAAPFSARSAVHEYGGGAWWVRDDVLWFVDWSTQRVHRLAPGGEPVALTADPPVERGLRYADGDVSPDGSALLCVQEEHTRDGRVLNTVVRLDASTPSTPQVVVDGPDFVAAPRWRPDGRAWCWLEWDLPDMPWDATRLVVSGPGGERTVVAGGRSSVVQPTWAADGSLWFSDDRSGFWSLYRWTDVGGVEPALDLGRDIGFPAWVFGERCFAHLDGGRVAFVAVEDGMDRLGVLGADGDVTFGGGSATVVQQVAALGDGVVAIGASPTTEAHIVTVTIDGREVGEPVALVPPRDLGIDPAWWSTPEPIDFPTADGSTAHALLYRPRNPEHSGPPGARPPLLVVVHGGPTSAARPVLRPAIQYWTTRGFAVVDVNHRGSTGYGRAYRRLLEGRWGVADVEDCAAVVRHLVGRGDVDPDRVCIRGGSAGGFTTLAALAFEDVFSAGASHYGIGDLTALAADTHKFESRYLDRLVGPWPQARATYEERSPLRHADRIDRPLAVFQGLDDPVVPPVQSEAIVEAVRAAGVPVAYVTFPGEQHGFRQAANIRAALDGELSFYAQVLGFELPAAEGIDPIPVANLGRT